MFIFNTIWGLFSKMWRLSADPKNLRIMVVVMACLLIFGFNAIYRVYQFDKLIFIREVDLTTESTPVGNVLLRDGRAILTSNQLCITGKEYFIIDFDPITEHKCRLIGKLYNIYLEDASGEKVHTTAQPFNQSEINKMNSQSLMDTIMNKTEGDNGK